MPEPVGNPDRYIPRPELAQSRDGIFAWLLRHSATIRRLQRWLVFFGTEYFFKSALSAARADVDVDDTVFQ